LSGRAVWLKGRSRELRMLAGLVTAVQARQSRVLVLRGEPGVGKTALLDELAGQARGCWVVRTAGVQSEMELAFAGLHQLLAPMLDRLEQLPGPQAEALRTVFGISAGPPPDRFLVGLAVLSLLPEAARERPLMCVIDDQQWLDRASAQALGFAARRLSAEPVGLVFAARTPGGELAGLPELTVEGLAEGDARAVLDSALSGPLDARVRDQIVAEAGGNPLALLELPRGMTAAELAGGFGLPGAQPGGGSLTGRIEDSFRRQLDALPAEARQLLLLAAADPAGDPALVWRAAGRLGLPVQSAAAAAAEAGLAEFGMRVRFRHPLVRSTAYRSASFPERQLVHRELAEATDPAADPDRRAWHRAQAAAGPDEDIAAELERSAGRAQARGGLAAAAAFLERAVRLTADPARLVERALAAAAASVQAGAFDQALGLLVMTENWPLDDFASARVDLLRGQVAFAAGLGSDAPPLLLKAARRLETLDPALARDTYLDAWQAAMYSGHLASAGDLAEVSHAARGLPPPAHPRPADLLLDGLALLVTEGPAAAAATLQQAMMAFTSPGFSPGEILRWSWLARTADSVLWSEEGRLLTARQLQLAREAGALGQLPFPLRRMVVDTVRAGDFAAAASLVAEIDAVCEATGSRVAPSAAAMLESFRGREAEAIPLIQATIEEATAWGLGMPVTYVLWATAVLNNGLSRYADALAAAQQASAQEHVWVSVWVLPELIEAAARSGDAAAAGDALARLAATTQAGQTDFGLGIEARSRALVTEGKDADGWYAEAIERLGRTRIRGELARAHLLYGEWLRRQGQRAQAREQLSTAFELLDGIGMEAFAERARRELLATGESARKRTARTALDAGQELTAQEAQVAQLARDGLSNPEIAARLFISSHTVQYHLGKVFTKLGITSRGQLHRVLPGGADAGQQARSP
jgi:DNA-binding CsgD family transcriptional regulator